MTSYAAKHSTTQTEQHRGAHANQDTTATAAQDGSPPHNRWDIMATKTETLIQRYGNKAADVLADKTIPASWLAKQLTEAGYPISATVIKDYRRKQTTTYEEEEDTR